MTCGGSVTVELLGVARLAVGVAVVEVPCPSPGTVGDLTRALGARLPGLLGSVLEEDGAELADGFALSMDGRGWTRDPAASLGGTTRVLLLSIVAGGACPQPGSVV